MSNTEKQSRNRFFSLILSFLLSVFLLVTTTTLVIYGFILNGNGVIGSLRETNYYEGIYVRIRDTVGDRLIPTGLPHSIIDDAFTPYAVYNDLNEYVSYMFANDLPDLQRESIAEVINYNIDEYLFEIDTSRTEVGYEAIDEIVEMIIDNYNDYVGSQFLAYIARISNVFRSHMLLLIAAGALGILVTTIIIYSVSRRFKHLTVRYFAISFGSAALMIVIAPLTLRIWGGHHRLGIGPEHVYDFIMTHIERSISILLLIGAIFTVLYLIFIFISARLRKKLIRV